MNTICNMYYIFIGDKTNKEINIKIKITGDISTKCILLVLF